jgi:hypothetical protein
MVAISMPALQGSLLYQAIDKLNRTVVAKAELPGECRDRGTCASGQAFNGH